MKEEIKKLLEDQLRSYAYYRYTDQYSSGNYSDKKEHLEYIIAPLITLATSCGLDLSTIKASYCGCECVAEDFLDCKQITQYW